MCGICAIIFEPGINGSEINIGRYLFEMAHRMQIRAQDSAGFAVFQNSPRQIPLVQIMEVNANGHNGEAFRFTEREVTPESLESVLRQITADSNSHVIGHGQYMRIVKDLGLVTEVNAKLGIDQLVGNYGMGHLRIATSSSDGTPLHAHPFGVLSRPDLAVLHNGEINDNGRLRRALELKGHAYATQVDSETIGVFAADRLKVHGDLERANYEFIEQGDGPFAYIIATEQGIAVVRDNFGLRKVMVGYHPGTDTEPAFIAMATDVSALNAIGANRNVHAPGHGSVEVHYKDQPLRPEKRNGTFFGGIKKIETPEGTYVIDVAEIKRDLKPLEKLSETLSRDEQIKWLRHIARERYDIEIPDGTINASYVKFGGLHDSPFILTRIVNAVLEGKVAEGVEKIEIRNPEGLYSLAAGLEGKVNLIIHGDVGNDFGSYLDIDGTVKVYGTVENGLANHGFRGRIVVHGITTELAGITNYGVHILVMDRATERIGTQLRSGSITTFGLGYNSGLYMNGGVMLNLGLDEPGEELGSGMTGGVIYAPNGATLGRDAKKVPLEPEDYRTIRATLERHLEDMNIIGLAAFSPKNPVLHITNGQTKAYDFRNFVKIVPK